MVRVIRFKLNTEMIIVNADADIVPSKQEIEGTIHRFLTEYFGGVVTEITCTELEVNDDIE